MYELKHCLKFKKLTIYRIGEELNKMWYIYPVEHYVPIKKNKKVLYELIGSAFQDKLFSEKLKKVQKYLQYNVQCKTEGEIRM